jgi:hypothetical protein
VGVPFAVPLIRTTWLPGKIVGLSLGFAVLLDPRYFTDEPTIRHELVHCRQFWRQGLVLHFLRYWLSKSYRLKAEVEAFREELACNNELSDPSGIEYEAHLNDLASSLSKCYGLPIAHAQARNLLDIETRPV